MHPLNSEHAGRNAPGNVARIPGFLHNGIARKMSATRREDRPGRIRVNRQAAAELCRIVFWGLWGRKSKDLRCIRLTWMSFTPKNGPPALEKRHSTSMLTETPFHWQFYLKPTPRSLFCKLLVNGHFAEADCNRVAHNLIRMVNNEISFYSSRRSSFLIE